MKCSDFPAGMMKVETAQESQIIVLPCELNQGSGYIMVNRNTKKSNVEKWFQSLEDMSSNTVCMYVLYICLCHAYVYVIYTYVYIVFVYIICCMDFYVKEYGLYLILRYEIRQP